MKPTILVIEDDPKSVRLVTLILHREGYQTVVATNGLQGLKIAQENPPDLILLDLMLPGMDGFEVLHRLRAEARTSDVPVIIISAKAQITDKQTAIKVGASAYLTKPYRRAELLPLIASLLSEGREEAPTRGTGVILVGSRGGEEALVVVHAGLALTSQGKTTTIVDFRPFSVEHSILLGVSAHPNPSPLSDPETTRQLMGLLAQHPSGLRLLNNLEGGGEGGQLTAEDVQGVLEALLSEDGIVLADLPLYPAQVLRQSADCCDLVVLVSQGDQASLMSARAALTLMERAGVEKNRTGIVLVAPIPEEGLPEFDREILELIPANAGPDDPVFHALADRLLNAAQSTSEGEHI
ncbi:MAG: response regulator [Chloroflexota bacterium]|nr:response regulator [Chloroflexota bacterium]